MRAVVKQFCSEKQLITMMFSTKILHGAAVLLVACCVVNAANLGPYFYREIDGINSVLDVFFYQFRAYVFFSKTTIRLMKKHVDCTHNFFNDFVNCNIMKKVATTNIERGGKVEKYM